MSDEKCVLCKGYHEPDACFWCCGGGRVRRVTSKHDRAFGRAFPCDVCAGYGVVKGAGDER